MASAAQRLQGSIPASAGEPAGAQQHAPAERVYPRECGGTTLTLQHALSTPGLSPRVRGNQRRVSVAIRWHGSIPASAGEPSRPTSRRGGGGVYPRECGGTGPWADVEAAAKGLSPRVRGNLEAALNAPDFRGSIPASAGEPARTPAAGLAGRVYPRECGGTAKLRLALHGVTGLSPRVRGNRQRPRPIPHEHGSIPASAGEPSRRTSSTAAVRVYPRECGGTERRCKQPAQLSGLSPRVRGNRRPRRRRRGRPGSIPASAGEPAAGVARHPGRRVYPRECGGTTAVKSPRYIA